MLLFFPHLCCLLLSEHPGTLGWYLFGKFSSIIISNIFCSILLYVFFSVIQIIKVIHFETILWFVNALGFVFHSFFLCISFWEFALMYPQAHWYLSSAISNLLMSTLKAFFIFVSIFLFLVFPFGSLLRFPNLCLHCPSVPVCHLLFSLEPYINHSELTFPVW